MRLILTLILAGVAASASGCSEAPTQEGRTAVAEAPLGAIEAQPDTRAELGIERWVVVREGEGLLLDAIGKDGLSKHRIHMQTFSMDITRNGQAERVSGFDIRTSGGGLIRVSREGHVLAFQDDHALFQAFSRDTEAVRAAHADEITYGCSVWGWIACGGAIVGAIAACGGPEDLPCIAAILAAAGCLDCFAGLFEGGGSGGPSTPPAQCTGGCADDPEQCNDGQGSYCDYATCTCVYCAQGYCPR
jgi:hypothetical protein